MDEATAKKILEQTKRDYDLIATHFSSTRSYFWPDLDFLLEKIPPQARLLDIGCGNGRLLDALIDQLHRTDVEYWGIDSSSSLIDISKERFSWNAKRFSVADALVLPFPDSHFDVVCSFAVLHHIPGKMLREQFVREALRALRPGGLALISCWNLNQEKYRQFLKIGHEPAGKGSIELDDGDALIPWKDLQGAVLAERYVHNFTPEELSELFLRTGFEVAECAYSSRISIQDGSRELHPNLYLIARAPSR